MGQARTGVTLVPLWGDSAAERQTRAKLLSPGDIRGQSLQGDGRKHLGADRRGAVVDHQVALVQVAPSSSTAFFRPTYAASLNDWSP